MLCQPSIRQWMLQLFPSIPKSLGRSCEQLLCGMCAVHGALGDCPGQHFPSQAGRDTWCSCTCVPSCVRIIAGTVYSTPGLCLCSARSLWCRYSWPRRVFACIPFFLKIQAESVLPIESVQGTEMLWGFHAPQCMWQGLPVYSGFLQRAALHGERKALLVCIELILV